MPQASDGLKVGDRVWCEHSCRCRGGHPFDVGSVWEVVGIKEEGLGCVGITLRHSNGGGPERSTTPNELRAFFLRFVKVEGVCRG